MTLSVILGLSLAASSAAASSSFQLVLENAPSPHQAKLEAFLNQASALLPSSLKSSIGRTVRVRFTDELGRSDTFVVPPCRQEDSDQKVGTPLQTRGQVRRGKILLNSAMISEIVKGEAGATRFGCGHGNLYRTALATLVHEIGHLYDFLDLDTEERRMRLRLCEQAVDDHQIQSCKAPILNPPRVVSRSPSFMSLMNWDYSPRNEKRSRSPDIYEQTRLEEAFAVNFEYFALDPEYACRRPALFEYYKDHFGWDPHPARSCKTNTVVPLSSQTEEKGSKLVDLDPARIYEIHYLFASSGPQFMSKFGHAMFRIITCAPHRQEVSAACLNDLDQHVVVSFRANPGETGINPWKGLTGGYPSLMYLFSFYPQIINEYTLDEPRDLISLPLHFTAAEKASFLYNVLETHWGYQGRYFFLGNNCATEAVNLLKRVIRHPSFQEMKITTPIGLYDQLALIRLIDGTLVEPRARGVKAGYLFPSNHDIFIKTYARLRAVNPSAVEWKDLEEFSDQTSAAERLALYQRLKSTSSDKSIANRFLILESYLFRLARRAHMGRISSEIQDSKDPDTNQKLKALLTLQGQSNPFAAPAFGYGVPLATDRTETLRELGEGAESKKDQLVNEILAQARARHQEMSEELDRMAGNRKFFLEEVSRNPIKP